MFQIYEAKYLRNFDFFGKSYKMVCVSLGRAKTNAENDFSCISSPDFHEGYVRKFITVFSKIKFLMFLRTKTRNYNY